MKLTPYLLPLTLLAACTGNKPDKGKITLNENVLPECNVAIQNAVVVDHVSAPVGGRRYFYACVAAYESLVPFHKGYHSLAGQLHDLKPAPEADTSKAYCLDLIAVAAHTYVSQKLVYKEDSIANFRERKLNWYKSRVGDNMYKNSIAYGDSVGAHIVRWSKKDSFGYYRGKEAYIVKKTPGYWQPTSPEFGEAVEPKWGHIRPAAVPNASYVKIPDPEPYSESKSSRFYQITRQVYDQVTTQDSSYLKTALYWDDNPNTMVHLGHATISLLKVSPAGHWLGMFGYVARQKKYNLMQTAEGFARMSAAIFDAFIVCWDTKYRTEYIRPETAIRSLIDSSWTSPIQTPLFPEYPSGHSVVSSTVATVATAMLGEYPIIDSAEYEFGLGVRKFNNFREAADQACMSRLYGGIHFIDAIKNGIAMGNQLGKYHLEHIKTKD
ncbi:MAG: vanadium-dependent haloperoxidase [Bacteroidetes bacterium]|nr:vanadium-dependent haloperoxidase [Bacteroidota bacterium]